MNKTDMVREIAKDHLHWTNQQIKNEIMRRFDVEVSSSAIVNAITSHKKRMTISGYSVDLRKKAKEYLALVGDYEQARSLLALAETER